jgi:hypothetical protein
MADHGFPLLIIGNPAGGFLRKRNMPGTIWRRFLEFRVLPSPKRVKRINAKPRRPLLRFGRGLGTPVS